MNGEYRIRFVQTAAVSTRSMLFLEATHYGENIPMIEGDAMAITHCVWWNRSWSVRVTWTKELLAHPEHSIWVSCHCRTSFQTAADDWPSSYRVLKMRVWVRVRVWVCVGEGEVNDVRLALCVTEGDLESDKLVEYAAVVEGPVFLQRSISMRRWASVYEEMHTKSQE